MIRKVLLFCPTYEVDGQEQICDETRASIRAMEWDGQLDVVIGKFNPYPPGHENTLVQYQEARRMTLAGGYDALFTVEHDMIVPSDALKKLAEVDAPVVYGLYMFRTRRPVVNALRAVRAPDPDMSLSLFPELLEEAFAAGQVEVSGAGFGCTLIHREVLEKLDMHRGAGGHPAPDMPLATDCLRNGFKQVCRMDVVCGHKQLKNGIVLWPILADGEMQDRVKVRARNALWANIRGASVHYPAGEVKLMPREEAEEFGRAGLVEVL